MSTESVFSAPLMKRDDETMYQYCVSFWPTAPLFGVPYRFAGMLSAGVKLPFATAAATAETAPEAIPPKAMEKVVEPAAKPVAEAAKKAEEVVETVETAVEEAVEEVAEAAPAAPELAPEEETGSAAPTMLYPSAPPVIDDLKLLKGVGPKLEAELNGIGIYTFSQIAGMSEANLMWIDEQISSVRGRPMRDDWAGQAKALAG